MSNEHPPQKPLYARKGDVFFTHSESILGRLIRWGQKERGEEPSWTNHTGVVVESGWLAAVDDLHTPRAVVVEALWKTRKGPLMLNGTLVRVFTPLPRYSDDECARLVAEAEAHVGNTYGWWKLLGFLARKITGIDVPKLFFVKNRPICSFLAALAHEAARRTGTTLQNGKRWPAFGMPAQAADPDEMLDFCESNPDFWEEVTR